MSSAIFPPREALQEALYRLKDLCGSIDMHDWRGSEAETLHALRYTRGHHLADAWERAQRTIRIITATLKAMETPDAQ